MRKSYSVGLVAALLLAPSLAAAQTTVLAAGAVASGPSTDAPEEAVAGGYADIDFELHDILRAAISADLYQRDYPLIYAGPRLRGSVNDNFQVYAGVSWLVKTASPDLVYEPPSLILGGGWDAWARPVGLRFAVDVGGGKNRGGVDSIIMSVKAGIALSF